MRQLRLWLPWVQEGYIYPFPTFVQCWNGLSKRLKISARTTVSPGALNWFNLVGSRLDLHRGLWDWPFWTVSRTKKVQIGAPGGLKGAKSAKNGDFVVPISSCGLNWLDLFGLRLDLCWRHKNWQLYNFCSSKQVKIGTQGGPKVAQIM